MKNGTKALGGLLSKIILSVSLPPGLSLKLNGRPQAAISEAKAVLKKKGVSYRNVYFDSDSEAGKFVENVYAYPTTYVVDRSGSIVGEPIVGAVTGKSQMEKLKSLIDQCIAADMK